MLPLLSLLSCKVELPYVPTQVCDEVRWALSGRVVQCTGDREKALALSAWLEAERACQVEGFTPAQETGVSAAHLSLKNGEAVLLEDAYACADAAAALSCDAAGGEPEAVWEQLVAAAPVCGSLRRSGADPLLSACEETTEGHRICPEPAAWDRALSACASADLRLWAAEPDGMAPLFGEAGGESWLGLSMEVCGDPAECAQMWTWIDGGGYLWSPGSRLWGAGEPDPQDVGSAVYVTIAQPGQVVTWYADPPTVTRPFVCQQP